MLDWINRDGKLILLSKVLRRFSYGFLSVTIAIYLKIIGLSSLEIGITLTTAVLGGALLTMAGSYLEPKYGRRTLLLFFSVLMALAGATFSVSTDFVVLLLATLIGTVNVTGSEFGAFLSLEQSIIPQSTVPQKRNIAYALYNMGGSFAGAGGALLGFLPGFLQQAFGMSPGLSFKPIFIHYSGIGLLTLVPYASLSRAAEASIPTSQDHRGRWRRSSSTTTTTLSNESKGRVVELSGFFALDAFGGGLIIQSIVAYWFFTRFGTPLGTVSLIFSVAGVFTALSFLVAARLSDRMAPSGP